MKQLIECVPNISEGNNTETINIISDIIKTKKNVQLLNVDPGRTTNRTVITFIGEPKDVVECAFQIIKTAAKLIDMRQHKGEHPRMGATDVCPLIPISNITMEETINWAHKLGDRVGKKLNIPGYYYEYAAKKDTRKNLANCRSGEYEGLKKKLSTTKWKPDFGSSTFNNNIEKTGATCISARDFLVAYNINLNTTSTRRANAIAFDIREAGRIKRKNGLINGAVIKDKSGNPIRQPGLFKHVKGIGWFIKEYGIAQISYNLTNINVSPLHEVFDRTCERAMARGLRVTGSELIGLVPKKVLIDAGKYFLKKQKRSLGISEEEIIKIAISSLGLNEVKQFNPKERIIEYVIEKSHNTLATLSLNEFLNQTASESPAPGGGSISAYVGALGISLGTMVANLSSHKRGWDNEWEKFSKWAEKGIQYQQELLTLVDEDTKAFNKIIQAYSLPKENKRDEEKREEEIQKATKYAIKIPLNIMDITLKSMQIMESMVKTGNPNSITDAAVGALCSKTAVLGAFLNVKINCNSYNDKKFVQETLKKGEELSKKAIMLENKIIKTTNEKI